MFLAHGQPHLFSPRLWLLALVATWVLSCAQTVNAQSPGDPAGKPPATAQAQPLGSDPASKPAAPTKPKRVITNEDLEPRSSGNANAGGAKIPGEDSLLLQCNASCETEARNELGYDSDSEEEWRMQIVPARHELMEDSVWRGMLRQAMQQSKDYCNLLQQQSQKSAPSGNDYRSQVQRSKNAQYFENMERILRQGLETTRNRIQGRIEEVQALSAARAAMMYVQATRIFERGCDSPGTR